MTEITIEISSNSCSTFSSQEHTTAKQKVHSFICLDCLFNYTFFSVCSLTIYIVNAWNRVKVTAIIKRRVFTCTLDYKVINFNYNGNQYIAQITIQNLKQMYFIKKIKLISLWWQKKLRKLNNIFRLLFVKFFCLNS